MSATPTRRAPTAAAARCPDPSIPEPRLWRCTTARGLDLVLRELRVEDEPLLEAFVAGLSKRTLFLRFGGFVRELSSADRARLGPMEPDKGVALVALDPSPPGGGPILGLGRLIGPPGADLAELAVVVADPFQGKGIGAELLRRLVAIAADRGVRRLWGLALRQNVVMIELARRLGFEARARPSDPDVELLLCLDH